jgi:SAM-dependent methyltransferase
MAPNETERQRLRALSDIYDPDTIRHLEDLGVGEGWRCLEVGAGEGSIARWLSARVGAGSVVATDLDTRFLDFPAPGNVQVVRHDVAVDPSPGDPFDLIHARFVLCHLAGRDRVLQRLATWLKPGGWLLVEDPFLAAELGGDPLVVKFYAGFVRLLTDRVGSDYRWALTLPQPLRDAGLVRTGGAAHIPADARAGADRATAAAATVAMRKLAFDQMRAGLLGAGLLTGAEAEQLDVHLTDPDLVVYCGGSVSGWGQRPTR